MSQTIDTQQLTTNPPVKNFWSELITAPFVTAVVILGIAAILTGPVASMMALKQSKEALPLKKELHLLDDGALGPYRLLRRNTLEPIVVEALGTEHYVNWMLEDTDLPPRDPLRLAVLFVTYYTGGSNLVPHTPDVCYLGAGYSPGQPHENKELDIRNLSPGNTRLPIRVCTFVKTAIFDNQSVSVVYTFQTNGQYVNTRTGVRLLINDLRDTYAYFSKVEVSFPGATREQSIAGSKKLFDHVLPVLQRDHWPDFEAAEEMARKLKTSTDH